MHVYSISNVCKEGIWLKSVGEKEKAHNISEFLILSSLWIHFDKGKKTSSKVDYDIWNSLFDNEKPLPHLAQ